MSSYSNAFEKHNQFQNILLNSIEKLGEAERGTMSFIFEDDHFHMILESMKEVKQGKIVAFQSAFSDLD